MGIGLSVMGTLGLYHRGETAVLLLTDGRFVPWSGFAVIMPMIVALLANDAE